MRAAESGDGGIQFETDPQFGGWLHIETTGDDGSGRGMFFDANGGPAIVLEAGGIELHATTTSLSCSAPDYLFQGDFSGNDDFVVNMSGNVLLNSGFGSISSDSTVLQLISNTVPIDLIGVPDVSIKGNTPTGFQDILRVTHDPTGAAPPSFHIYAGAAWVADL